MNNACRSRLQQPLGGAFLVTVASLAWMGVAQADVSRFDGSWRVDLRGASSVCGLSGSAYRLRVKQGRIRLSGGSGSTGRGRVRDSGAISIKASRALATLRAAGKLRARSGRGSWSVPLLGCSGAWSASRVK